MHRKNAKNKDMKRITYLFAFVACLVLSSRVVAQDDLDSALVVTEIATDDADAVSDTAATGSWTFNPGGGVSVTVDSDENLDEMMEDAMDGLGDLPRALEKIANEFSRFSWLTVALPILFFFLLPLLIIFLIMFFVYKGRKAKYNAYQKMAESGQPIPQETIQRLDQGDLDMRDQGIKNVCVGVGLAIFLGLLMDEIGIGIGALVTFIGVAKLVIWYVSRNDRKE